MASSDLNSNEISLPNQVSIALQKDILHTDQPSPESLILFHLINGHTSAHLAAVDLLATVAQAQDPMFLFILTTEIAAIAMEYPTLHPQFIALISAIYSLPSSTPQRSEFLGSLSTSIGDLAHMNYANLYETVPPRENLSDITRDHIALNAFYARLLGAVGEVQAPQEVIQGLNDALFLISGALEDEKTAHNYPNVDVPTAAMYMIHAEKLFFEESMKRTGQELAATSPLWGIRGKLWHGEGGLSLERWKFWKTRFEVYASNQGLLSETRNLARMAVRSMDRVDHNAI